MKEILRRRSNRVRSAVTEAVSSAELAASLTLSGGQQPTRWLPGPTLWRGRSLSADPTAEGVWTDAAAGQALGQRQLAIVDLSPAVAEQLWRHLKWLPKQVRPGLGLLLQKGVSLGSWDRLAEFAPSRVRPVRAGVKLHRLADSMHHAARRCCIGKSSVTGRGPTSWSWAPQEPKGCCPTRSRAGSRTR